MKQSAAQHRQFSWLTTQDIAHRGLFDPDDTPENSRAAVDKAIEQGFAIEIDVRLTMDENVIVFHDKTLDRLTTHTGRVKQMGFASLRTVTYKNAPNQTIASLTEIIDQIDGRTPLFIEVKTNDGENIDRLCAGIRHALEGYRAPIAIMSFDQHVLHWFKLNEPKHCRGLVIGKKTFLKFWKRWQTALFLKKNKPDFIACDVNFISGQLVQKWRQQAGTVLTWTVKSVDQINKARHFADALIFERNVTSHMRSKP